MKKESEKKESKEKKLTKKKIILYIIAFIFAIYMLYVIYLLIRQPTNIFTIEEGKLYQEETSIGYVIRDEQVVKGEHYKNGMEHIKAEGERTAKDENIFRYYSTNESTLTKKIAELDVKIQQVIESEANNIFPTDVKLLENQIDEKINNISQITDVTKLEEYKKEIDDIIKKKAKIAGEASPAGSYLRQLIDERKKYESELNSGAEYVKSPKSGIVSYKVDGLEETLTPNNFNTLSKEYLESLNLKTGKTVATNEECGKVIDNFYCYIATISNSEEAKNAQIGDDVSIRMSNNIEVTAEITNLIKENDEEVLIILKLSKQVEELINYRKISFDLIWWSASGLKVPNQAIVVENELNYVVRNRAGYLSKLLVNVTKRGENYSIVKPYSTEQLKELGFSNKEILSYRKITLYDEILLNPDLSELE